MAGDSFPIKPGVSCTVGMCAQSRKASLENRQRSRSSASISIPSCTRKRYSNSSSGGRGRCLARPATRRGRLPDAVGARFVDERAAGNRRRRRMSRQVARTPGAKRAGDGEYVFDLAAVNHILGGPDYSTANGACVEGDRMIVALMRMPAGTGAEPHSHPNEQWIYILQGTFRAKIGEKEIEAKPGSVVYVPSNVVHSGEATPEGDLVFFTCKDASHSLHGVKAA